MFNILKATFRNKSKYIIFIILIFIIGMLFLVLANEINISYKEYKNIIDKKNHPLYLIDVRGEEKLKENDHIIKKEKNNNDYLVEFDTSENGEKFCKKLIEENIFCSKYEDIDYELAEELENIVLYKLLFLTIIVFILTIVIIFINKNINSNDKKNVILYLTLGTTSKFIYTYIFIRNTIIFIIALIFVAIISWSLSVFNLINYLILLILILIINIFCTLMFYRSIKNVNNIEMFL